MPAEITPNPLASPEAAVAPAASIVPVPPVIETVVEEVKHLASVVEADAALAAEAAYREVARLEAAANAAISPLSHRAVGVLHSDTEHRLAAQIGNEGPHQEQVHTSLKEG